jgi:hypothetical protein
MIVSPQLLEASDSYRVVALRESTSPRENRLRFAKQHRNNAVGRVFTAAAIPAHANARSGIKARPKDKGREMVAALISRNSKTLF